MRLITIPLVIFLLTCLLSNMALAQPLTETIPGSESFRIAKELFEEKKYISALQKFEHLQLESGKSSIWYMEAEYYIAVCKLGSGSKEGLSSLKEFVDNNPESLHYNAARLKLADADFEKKRYKKALSNYEKIDLYRLTASQKEDCHFKKAYCFMKEGENDKARSLFYEIKDGKGIYSESAKYYWAHINYLDGNYETALMEFNKLENSPEFSGIVPFYKAQIYYLQNKFEKVIEMAPPLLKAASDQRKIEISGIIGNSYYRLERYSEAIPYLQEFHKGRKKVKTSDNYILGFCHYKNSQFSEAIKYLEKAVKGKDAMAQNAYYHLADAYLQSGEKQKAMIAFRNASELELDDKISEDALFQYAKIAYELQYSPFNESINAFDKYIARYPDSEHNDAAYDYLVEVFMTTRNYKDALSSLDKIKVKNPSIKKAYQKVAYSRGLELFKNLDFKSAISMFNKSLTYSQYDSQLKALASYWKGESYYRLGDLNTAISEYRKFQDVPGAYSLNEYATSFYNTGYSYFDQDKFEMAQSWYEKFLNATRAKNSQLVADAYNRLGDCNFIRRDFDKAISNYTKAYETEKYDADYALFQIAFCHGRLRDENQKINGMNKLQVKYPESQYIDDALFETGKAWENLQNVNNASKSYINLIERYPSSPYQAKAHLQLGLINYNQNNYSKSLDYYKQVVTNYPASNEAKAALNGIRSNYVDMNRVDEYFAYTRGLNNISSPSVSEHDSLLFTSAEKLYMDKAPEAKRELTNYVEKFPKGKFALVAHYYKAECHLRDNEVEEAANDYDYVLEQTDNIFTETTLLKASGIAYDLKDFSKALSLFERLETYSNTSKNKRTAMAGKMRCNFELKNFEEVTKIAYRLRNTEKIPVELEREANYKSAKSYYFLNQHTKALALWRKIASDPKSLEGAEGKYRICEYYFNNDRLKEAEDEVMDFIDKNTPHQYWLAKSFILLARVYQSQNDLFQASHTLKSIIENYSEPEDGIIEESEKLLQEIEAMEDTIKNNPDSKKNNINTSNPQMNN